MQESVSYFQAVVSDINHSYTTFIKGKKPKYLKMLGFFFAFKPYTLKVRGLFLNLKEEISGSIANNLNPYNQDIASLAVVKTSKGEDFLAGSRYFCESLFWASQPKQAAKT
ncbi:hypothetical protein BPLS_P4757 [Bathymodiolus platifrons methanotrophic gill symbiont]|uniref:hypothetical protein n=1 Tax=Bathymodiolus platifrons methanotrophic gill symbiont TaxID=113268 RepID=UPI001B7910BE|nr:hypothetical protein [Bathymodiolus platifrons methanotrophic gill symbiont]GFO76767.1 hypothetical protein BPLS_P4757 [Bathymodiolus platifrons methanotrophic gill symbiont]